MAIEITAEEFEKKFGIKPFTKEESKKISAFERISNAFKSNIQKAKEGYTEARDSSKKGFVAGVGNLFEGAGKMASGGIGALASPLAPALEPTLGAGISYAGKKLAGTYGENVERGLNIGGKTGAERTLENVSNYNDIVGAVAGGVATGKAVPTLTKGTVDASSSVARGTGRVLKGLGEKSYGVTVIPEETTSIALRKYKAKYPDVTSRLKAEVTGNQLEGKPITEANTAARYGLMGTESELGVQATRLSKGIWETKIQPELAKVKGQVNMKDFFSQIEKEIQKTPELTRRNSLREGLNALKEDFKNVNKISLEKLQEYKEGWAEFLPDAVYKGKPIAGSLKAVKDLAAKKAREVIYKHTGAKEAYIDYGNLKSIMKAADKSVRDPAKRSLGRNVWEFIMDKAVTPVATTAGRVLYKTGEGLEFVGQKGAKKVGDIVNQ